jgi:hypothetical protein
VPPLAYLLVDQDARRLRRLALIARFNGPARASGTLALTIQAAARDVGGLRGAKVATLRELVDASLPASVSQQPFQQVPVSSPSCSWRSVSLEP